MTQILNRFTGVVIVEGEMNLRELMLHYVETENKAGRSANLSYADLSYADLSSANLRSADLRSANLRYANLSYADLRYANLSYANLSSANLSYANLSYANLSYANLSYANEVIKIKAAVVFSGLYQYMVMPVIAEDGIEYVCLGCHFRKVSEWEADFWNNLGEFPNDGDKPSKLRWMAYQSALHWLEINRETKGETDGK